MAGNNETFWMVWALDGDIPRFKHYSQSNALAEAERLARLNPGKEFVVVQSLAGYLLPAPTVQRIDYDPIPF